MLPSSLIFAVILAVWAAYLIRHWVRRREHIATARSVDRFSAAMRVLERRQRAYGFDMSTPSFSSYAVSPVRPAATTGTVGQGRGNVSPRVAERAEGDRTRSAPVSSARTDRSARARGVVLLGVVSFTVCAAALSALGLVSWWATAVALGLLTATVGGLRRMVLRAASASASVRSRRSAVKPQHAQPTTPRLDATSPHVVVPAAPVAQTSVVYDIEAVEHITSDGVVTASQSADAALGAWEPVEVPPPTYTLKAKAVAVTLPEELPADGRALLLDEEFEELPVAIRDLA